METVQTPLYQAFADELRGAMADGRLPAGARLPSVREAARSRGLSINTVLAAYRHLEARGLVEARPQSGYFVRSRLPAPPAPRFAARPTPARPAKTAVLNRIATVIAAQSNANNVDLSLACPKGSDFYPGDKLARIIADTARRHPELLTDYALPPGSLRLRREIARHALDLGVSMTAEDVILTNGCMEALQFALRTVTRAGDAIAVESPTYFNLIPLAEALGLRTIEVPTDPGSGMSMDALELLLSERRVSAVVTMPNVHNPLGISMPQTAKRRLAALAAEYRVPVIEDALYAELQYAVPLQPAVKAFDRDGWVILCASYSKTLVPGIRAGWMEAGRFQREVADLKFCSSVAQPAVTCEALGVFLENGGYAQHMRRLRRTYAGQIDRLRGLIDQVFPAGTRATEPTGGFLVWVELPPGCDADRLFDEALARGISITPGTLFSPSGRYTRHIRLSGCYPFSERHIHALVTLGQLASRQLGG
ncbi:MAG TPA: PLP-dependent aminotransferase family protein [Pseudothauera hydrothermalis]|jgi:DNA-binding transcriptional MocR family regulator|nr:GntR family transcriptional regulator [Rhodocyclaceae bacterium]AVZ78881.1 PLP-dependent aminotransferase family protein [Zoogloeaceae bacteirum Par-f-2]HNQ75565.1 PLP-dependent aminotransferase family protein [Pseudothauera hydrothermalis]